MGKYFGTDGIRGVANDTLTLDTAFKVGRFIGDFTVINGGDKIVIGKDTRKSSSMFENMIAAGIASSGCNVYLLGYCSTPCLAYVTTNEEFYLGVMISASHNPFYDNGIKIFNHVGTKLNEEVEYVIEDYIDNPREIDYVTKEEIGDIINYSEGVETYKNWLRKIYPSDLSRFKLLVDCANGSNSYISEDVLKSLGANVTTINNKPNGININNGCGSTHLENIKEEIVKGDYDLGLAYDGDADRLIALNSKGEELTGDKILYILSKYLKAKGKLENSTLVITGYSNAGLTKSLKEIGVKTDIVENGDKYVLESMLKNDYSLGGENSGHIIIKDDSYFGDGLKTALCLLSALIYFDKSVDELLSDLIIYPAYLKNVTVKDKKTILEDQDIKNKIDEINKLLNGDGKLLIRPSGTEPLIRVLVEASSQELSEKYVSEIISVIEEKNI